jgi:hypothetical protein
MTPPAAALIPKVKARRVGAMPLVFMASLIPFHISALSGLAIRCALYRCANAGVGAASADVSGHRCIDLRVGRFRVLKKQRRCLHDLARLAIAALRNLEIDPRLLKWVKPVCAQLLDRRHDRSIQVAERDAARARCFFVYVYGTAAAQSRTAAKTRAG